MRATISPRLPPRSETRWPSTSGRSPPRHDLRGASRRGGKTFRDSSRRTYSGIRGFRRCRVQAQVVRYRAYTECVVSVACENCTKNQAGVAASGRLVELVPLPDRLLVQARAGKLVELRDRSLCTRPITQPVSCGTRGVAGRARGSPPWVVASSEGRASQTRSQSTGTRQRGVLRARPHAASGLRSPSWSGGRSEDRGRRGPRLPPPP